jgi:hypothetical protein
MRTQTQVKQSLPVGSTWAQRLDREEEGRLLPASGKMVKKRAPLNLLDRFLAIVESPDSDASVLKFASRWGLLSLCKHGLPIGHNPGCNEAMDKIDDYRQFSEALYVLRTLAMEISNGRAGIDTDWERVDVILCGPDFPPRPKNQKHFRKIIGVARTEFEILMQRLIEMSRLQPRFRWDGTAWAIDFDTLYGPNLVAILTIQLMGQLGGKVMRKCRNCPGWFQPIGRQVYCKRCGLKAAWRSASKKAYDARKEEALKVGGEFGGTRAEKRSQKPSKVSKRN